MALFGKKKTVNCVFCGKEAKGGLLRGLFRREIEGQYVCDDCYGEVDLPTSFTMKMTLDQFRGYQAFRTENQKLKADFHITEEVDFGAFEEKFYFDYAHSRMCMDKNLKKTIFEGKQIRSFVIKEDESVILHGGDTGLQQNESMVRRRVMRMEPMVRTYNLEMQRYQERMDRATEEQKKNIQKPVPRFETKPFQKFQVEIHLDHPYWQKITADIGAPHFDSNRPDVFDYLTVYDRRYGILQQLAGALMTIAFPAVESAEPVAAEPVPVAAPVSADTVEELKRYKELLDMGIITQEEFTAKKRQLMGI